jgi:signal transduction histidine kinase/DNA-binding response OmpR family regulator
MNTHVATICSDETLVSAAKMMSEKKHSCIVVVDGGWVTGILTETDILKRIAGKHNDFDSRRVVEIMSSPVVRACRDLSVLKAAKMMEERHIKRLPVLEDERLVGIVTQTDIVRVMTSCGEWRDVSQIMSRNVAAVERMTTVAEAAQVMTSRGISCVVAVEGGEAIGILTERDMLSKIVAHHKDPTRTTMEEVMSAPVVSVPPNFSVFSASRIMEAKGIRRLTVMEDRRLCGIVAQTDIFRATNRELQEALQARKAAEAANEAKNLFLARMSHEIRTPLNGVMGVLHLLANSELTAKQQHYVHIAEASADALLSLISQVLDFSKIEAGKFDLEYVEFDLHALLKDTTEMFVQQAQHKGLELTCRIGPAVPRETFGDPDRIRQILINLVGNAIKFTPRGEVVIRAEVVDRADGDRHLRFEVRDTGIGIPGECRGGLFDAFSQVDASTTREYGGTGLGLSICKQLVELMGGHIEVESQLDQGSTFSFTIPFRVVRERPLQECRSAGDLCGQRIPANDGDSRALRASQNKRPPLDQALVKTSTARVLIVEDNEINQMVASEILKNVGLRHDIAANGHLAIEAISKQPYDLVLMDCEMPEMDGLTAVREIRRLENEGRIAEGCRGRLPVIAITAHAIQGDCERCLAAGMDDYVSKPIDPDKLFSVIRRWLPGCHWRDQATTKGAHQDAQPSVTLGEEDPANDRPRVDCRRQPPNCHEAVYRNRR